MTNKRETWIDSLKGLGILFVVLGHCYPPQEGLTNYLYSFHIALFFFISGYLLRKEPTKEKFKVFVQKRFQRLMLPYFGYGLFTYAVWLLIGRNFGLNKELAITPLKPLIGLFYGNGFDNYLVFNIALWFLPALFSTLLLYYLVFSLFKNKLALLLAISSIFTLGLLDSNYSHIRLPWGINISFIAVLFIYLGHQGKGLIQRLDNNNKYLNMRLIILLLAAGYYLQILNHGVSFNSHDYGNVFYFLFSACFSILGFVILTKLCLDNKLFQFFGKNSLTIFALHILTFSLISAVLKYIFRVDYQAFKISQIGRFTYFVSSILIVSVYSLSINYLKTKLHDRQSRKQIG